MPLLSRNVLPDVLVTPDTYSRTSDFESADGRGPQVATGIDEEQPESQILAQARAQAERVAQLRLDADEQRKASAQRRKEDQAAKKQKKQEEQAAAKEAKNAAAKAQPKAPIARKRKHSPEDEAPDGEVVYCEYELKQQATVKSNNQMLKFLEDASEKNCKMLKENCETIQEITTGGLAQDR
jgi:hypothetical protein